MKKLVLISIIAISYLNVKAQNESVINLEEKAYKAYIASNVFMWKKIATEADKFLADSNATVEEQISAIKLKYGFLYCCLSNQDKENYKENIDEITQQANKLLKEKPSSSDLYTISAALMSIEMAFVPRKGATLEAQSGKYIDKALTLDSLNANAWRQYAGSKYFTPKMWGGDINEALSGYQLAILLYEKEDVSNNWFYLDSMVWLGIAYEKNGEKEKAISTYEKVLEIAPDYSWVKNHLLPNIKKSSK